MKYICKKTENCFAGSQTYEYALTVPGEAFCTRLSGWDISKNQKLRRPVFTAERNGVNIKGVLAYSTVKVSFPQEDWQGEKDRFDKWLEEQDG